MSAIAFIITSCQGPRRKNTLLSCIVNVPLLSLRSSLLGIFFSFAFITPLDVAICNILIMFLPHRWQQFSLHFLLSK